MEYDFLKWLGHASFVVESGGKRIFVDPFRLPKNAGYADIIFITHPHFDHLSEADITGIADGQTHFVAPEDAAKKLDYKNITLVGPGDKGAVLGIDFEAVSAYNVKPERQNFHPKSSGWVGYIITVEGKRIYHPGDTDLIDEMKGIDVDLALIPCGGKYVMDIDDAIRATGIIKAGHYAPIHYKAIVGKDGAAAIEKKFRESVRNSIILKEEGEAYYSF